MIAVAVAWLVGTGATAFALRPQVAGSSTMWATLGVAYGALATWSLYRMWDDGTFVDRLAPRWGDLSLGLVTAIALLAAGWGTRMVLAPEASERSAWVFRILLQMGGPDAWRASLGLAAATIGIAVFEELTWRGLVLSSLEERIGSRRAWPLAAVLYASTMVPTLFTLGDPHAGPNPMLLLAALGAGLVWTFLASFLGRLPPVILSHVAFTYFSPIALSL